MTKNVLSDYLSEIAQVRATRAGTGEMSYYPALAGALNGIGGRLKPRVFCVPNLRNTGVGIPDMALFAGGGPTAPAEWPEGRPPDRGVVEVDDIPAPLAVKLASERVADYLAKYRLASINICRFRGYSVAHFADVQSSLRNLIFEDLFHLANRVAFGKQLVVEAILMLYGH